MKLTKSELRRVIREVISESMLESESPLVWEEDEDSFGRKFISTRLGVYDWSPSTGHLKFVSSTNGRVTLLSKDLSTKRSGGFHDIKTEEQAIERVKQHMARQKK